MQPTERIQRNRKKAASLPLKRPARAGAVPDLGRAPAADDEEYLFEQVLLCCRGASRGDLQHIPAVGVLRPSQLNVGASGIQPRPGGQFDALQVVHGKAADQGESFSLEKTPVCSAAPLLGQRNGLRL